ncbi:MAG: hypothetical protein L6V84_06770 [Oscillospiraceae bacterium]|nr:MAG: hypothetical protein L6V84_06770 [Oscillospiraceae bacterium]
MNGLGQLIRRDCKLFFKDKGLFFSSLISPLILLVLYATFLGRIYRGQLHLGSAGGTFIQSCTAGRNSRGATHLLPAGGLLCDRGCLRQPADGIG